MKAVKINKDVTIGGLKNTLVLLAGVCVIENEKHTLLIAEKLKKISEKLKLPLVFKASYDKANRSSIASYRGVGIKSGLKILAKVKDRLGLPVITDVHSSLEVKEVAQVADVIQIPAFLCRQTDLLIEAAKAKKALNIKKGQFLAPWDIKNIISKIEKKTNNRKIIITERGAVFGYNNLVVDFRALPIMREFAYPVVFDATHSVQLPGGNKNSSAGERKFVPFLSRAAAGAGIDGLFLEVHENPKRALCDGPNTVALKQLPALLREVKDIDCFVKANCKL